MRAEDVLRSYVAAFNESDVDAVASLYAPSTTYTNPVTPQPVTSQAAVREFEAPLFAAFSAVRVELLESVAQDDRVAARVLIHKPTPATCTHRTGLSLPPVAPSSSSPPSSSESTPPVSSSSITGSWTSRTSWPNSAWRRRTEKSVRPPDQSDRTVARGTRSRRRSTTIDR